MTSFQEDADADAFLDEIIQAAVGAGVAEKHAPAVDMAILAGCDHMIMTVGTFGWWAAYLGADARGGEVVHYDSEFVMEHPINKGNVVSKDYYPERWVAMGDATPSSFT